MKKICTLFIATIALTFGVNNKVSAQVEEGSILFDLYYGYPNGGKTAFDFLADQGGLNLESKGIGPIGARFEYMVADNLGVGVDFNYVGSSLSYDDTVSVYNSTTSMWETDTYNYKYTRNKIRVSARVNYHFVSTDAVDAYVGFGAGYKHKINKFTSSDPNAEDLEGALNLIPVAVRICIGTRFFFTDNIGINLELGLGGPLMSGGLTLKF